VFSKLAAGRKKDFRFIRALLSRKLIKLTSVRRFISWVGLMNRQEFIAAADVTTQPFVRELSRPQPESVCFATSRSDVAEKGSLGL
jgi:hypothetical protein